MLVVPRSNSAGGWLSQGMQDKNKVTSGRGSLFKSDFITCIPGQRIVSGSFNVITFQKCYIYILKELKMEVTNTFITSK